MKSNSKKLFTYFIAVPIVSTVISITAFFLTKTGISTLELNSLQSNKVNSISSKAYGSSIILTEGDTITAAAKKSYIFNEFDGMKDNRGRDIYTCGWKMLRYKDIGDDTVKSLIQSNGIDTSPLLVPIKLNGWFRVYIGYDEDTGAIRVKQNSEDTYDLVGTHNYGVYTPQHGNQIITEKSSIIHNFTNDSLTIAPDYSQTVRIAYVKFVALTATEIALYTKKDEGLEGNRIMYDFDGYSGFYSGKFYNSETFDSKMVQPLAAKNIGEINWCLGTTGMLNYNSKYGGKALSNWGKYENQLRKGDKIARTNILNILKTGKSPLEIIAASAEKQGVKVNASLRMDVFYNPAIYGFLNGSMYDKYKDCLQKGSFLMSYNSPKFRAYVENIFYEAVSIKNVDGITLDFCRYPTVFGSETNPKDKIKIINSFIRELRKKIPKGKTITVRIPYKNPESYGFDPKTWIKEGLINTLVPSNIDIDDFFNVKSYVTMVKGSKVKLYIGISADVTGKDISKEQDDTLAGNFVDKKTYLSPHQYLERAYDIYSAGADGLFLFNTSESLLMNTQSLKETDSLGDKIKIQKWHMLYYNKPVITHKIYIM
ncbi:hypothetical protein LL033_16265 [Clostridium estertheticum]|uniref:hypothetical protein n=1 Tax=Clostridium estertheticum TaxID=238834 RepID=UPI001C0CB8AE|nr:hypothetical protein [Clostridium estertheticum]MBU3218239.1 hypothetical protein [Clostridium estertheticum]WAG54186.1 hypothetical protein LL033_16265 [Clostridium estertheticum]